MRTTKEQNTKHKTPKTNSGITLIALVITIIVMLILVAVTISMAVNGGLFNQAGKAAGQTKNELEAEQLLANGRVKVNGEWYNSIEEYLNKDKTDEPVVPEEPVEPEVPEEPKEPISKETPYIGCYADVDGDKIADGVIYADLAIGGSGSWSEYNYSYEAEPAEELKDYYVSGTTDGVFGNGVQVLTVIEDEEGENKKDRFYVLALEDFTEDGMRYAWYHNAYENENTQDVTGEDFGTGKANTVTMIEKWNASAFGTQNGETEYGYKDVWGSIQESEQYDIVESVNDSSKWFVPSAGEWAAFADALNIATVWDDDSWEPAVPGNFISWYYWTSSQSEPQNVWQISMADIFVASDFMYDASMHGYDTINDASYFGYRVRLNATF